jgi:hypothetical protein
MTAGTSPGMATTMSMSIIGFAWRPGTAVEPDIVGTAVSSTATPLAHGPQPRRSSGAVVRGFESSGHRERPHVELALQHGWLLRVPCPAVQYS